MRNSIIFTLAMVIFEISMAQPSIDSVWFYEEDFCDEQNIVQICYILSEDTANISLQMSSDGGATWDVPIETLIGEEGNIGENIAPGTHCFEWLMSDDLPDDEGYEWTLKISTEWSIALVDSFTELDTSRYTINGNDGYVDVDSGYFVLTQDITDRNGRILTVDSIFVDTIMVTFRFKMVGSVGGADGISLFFSQYSDPPLARGGSIGISYTGGWGVAFDSWNNCCDIDGNHIETSIDIPCCSEGGWEIPTALAQYHIPFELIDNSWHRVDIDFEYPNLLISLDDSIYIDGAFTELSPFWAYIGFSGSTGSYHFKQIVDDFVIFSPHGGIIEISGNYTNILDSRPPNISISCATTITAGDTLTFEWSVDDLFWFGEPCSVYFIGCEIDTHYEVDGLSSYWIPLVACSECTLIVAAKDSFCNWGYDTCEFQVTVEPANISPVFVICPDDTAIYLGDTLMAVVLAEDADGDTLFYFIADAPSGTSFEYPALTFIPSDTGNFFFSITACDPWDSCDTCDFYVSVDTTSAISEKSIKPDAFFIDAQPNPFNSSCQITTAMNSKIEIYDLNGKQIETFEETPAIWQPEKEISSGIYLIRATTKDGLTETKRVVYLR